jgi:glycosyltransferase 2 family protein
MNDTNRRWLHRLGSALGLMGIVFVAYRLIPQYQELSFGGWGTGEWMATAALALASALSNLLLAFGWGSLIAERGFGQDARWYVRTYAMSQLAKYIPGNIFHYAARQALGAAAGIPQTALLISSSLEILFVSLAAACYAPLLVPVLWPAVPRSAAFALFGLLVAAGALVLLLLGRPHLRNAVFGYAGQVAMSSLIFLGCFILSGGQVSSPGDALTIAGAFAIAWLAGLLTPGAPAGLGVREAMLVFLLGSLAPSPVVLTATILGRMVTTLGDLVFFLAGRRL